MNYFFNLYFFFCVLMLRLCLRLISLFVSVLVPPQSQSLEVSSLRLGQAGNLDTHSNSSNPRVSSDYKWMIKSTAKKKNTSSTGNIIMEVKMITIMFRGMDDYCHCLLSVAGCLWLVELYFILYVISNWVSFVSSMSTSFSFQNWLLNCT